METKDREPDNQRFKEPVYGIRRTDQTKEGAGVVTYFFPDTDFNVRLYGLAPASLASTVHTA